MKDIQNNYPDEAMKTHEKTCVPKEYKCQRLTKDYTHRRIRNQGLNALHKDKHNGFVYTDNKCLFRCLALHDGKSPHN